VGAGVHTRKHAGKPPELFIGDALNKRIEMHHKCSQLSSWAVSLEPNQHKVPNLPLPDQERLVAEAGSKLASFRLPD
jgi:hypothetical protein